MKGLLMSFMVCFIVALPSVTSEKTTSLNNEGNATISFEIDTMKQHNKVVSDSLEKMKKSRVANGVSIHRRILALEKTIKSL